MSRPLTSGLEGEAGSQVAFWVGARELESRMQPISGSRKRTQRPRQHLVWEAACSINR